MSTKALLRRKVLLSAASIIALVASDAQARRLAPDMPSVEVRLEALNALQASVEAERSMRYAAPSGGLSRTGLPRSIPFGAPTPPPARPVPTYEPPRAIAQSAPKPPVITTPPAPKMMPEKNFAQQSAPKPVQTNAPVMATTEKPAPKMQVSEEKPASFPQAKPPVMQRPAIEKPTIEKPVIAQKEKIKEPEPVVVPKEEMTPQLPVTGKTKLAKDDLLSLPPESNFDAKPEPELDIVEESVDDDAKEFTLEDLVPQSPLSSTSNKQDNTKEVNEKIADATPPALPPLEEPQFTLPDVPDDKGLDLAKTDDNALEPMPLPEVEPTPELSLNDIRSTDNMPAFLNNVPDDSTVDTKPEDRSVDQQSLEKMPPEKPGTALDIADDAKRDSIPIIVPDMPQKPEIALPEMDEPKLTLPDIEEAEPTDSVATDNTLPDMPSASMPEVPPSVSDMQTPDIKTPDSTPAKDEGGLFPNLSKSFASFLGGKENKENKPVVPVAEEPMPEPPAPVVVETAPPMPQDLLAQTDTDEQDDPAQKENGLPPLPAFGDAQTSDDDRELPPLPAFDVPSDTSDSNLFGDNDLPELPAFNAPSAPATPPALPPLASVGTETKTAALETDNAESLPPLREFDVGVPSGDASLSVLFSQSETEVPLAFQQPLINLSKELIADGNSKIKVVAYASSSEDQRSIARRISLARALAVRAFLIDLGVDNVRISVQALGNEVPSGPSERADIIVTPTG